MRQNVNWAKIHLSSYFIWFLFAENIYGQTCEWWCIQLMLIMDLIYILKSKEEIEFRFSHRNEMEYIWFSVHSNYGYGFGAILPHRLSDAIWCMKWIFVRVKFLLSNEWADRFGFILFLYVFVLHIVHHHYCPFNSLYCS